MFLWVFPGVCALAFGQSSDIVRFLNDHVPESVAALVGASLLLVLPLDDGARKTTLTVDEAFAIDWGVLAMYGGGITLGKTVFDSGLATAIGENLTGVLPSEGMALIATSSAIATLVSELTSNVSSANMVVPLVLILGGNGATLAAIAASLASSLGFMLPISTPTNAIVYSSGYIPLGRMVRYGLILDVLGFIVIVVGVSVLGPLVLSR
jgi:sodium-dependent dicarboxylate transporter 2/3/5